MQDIVLRSSLIVLFDRNLLEWGQLFLGEILWWGGNFTEDNHPVGNYPGGSFPRTLQNVSAPCCICRWISGVGYLLKNSVSYSKFVTARIRGEEGSAKC